MTKSTQPRRAVLIVESHELLRMFLACLVETAGFEAILVDNADEALPILECRPDIALLVTNVVMPGSLDGVELAHAVASRWPSVKIIVASGKRGLMASDLPEKSLFLAKPFCYDAMASGIHALVAA